MNVERGSDKHGPRQDEAITGEDQPDIDLAPEEPVVGGTPAGMDQPDVQGRAELARWLQPSVFPAAGPELTASATETQAPDRIVQMLEGLPQDRVYQNVQEVWRALGGGTEDIAHRA